MWWVPSDPKSILVPTDESEKSVAQNCRRKYNCAITIQAWNREKNAQNMKMRTSLTWPKMQNKLNKCMKSKLLENSRLTQAESSRALASVDSWHTWRAHGLSRTHLKCVYARRSNELQTAHRSQLYLWYASRSDTDSRLVARFLRGLPYSAPCIGEMYE